MKSSIFEFAPFWAQSWEPIRTLIFGAHVYAIYCAASGSLFWVGEKCIWLVFGEVISESHRFSVSGLRSGTYSIFTTAFLLSWIGTIGMIGVLIIWNLCWWERLMHKKIVLYPSMNERLPYNRDNRSKYCGI